MSGGSLDRTGSCPDGPHPEILKFYLRPIFVFVAHSLRSYVFVFCGLLAKFSTLNQFKGHPLSQAWAMPCVPIDNDQQTNNYCKSSKAKESAALLLNGVQFMKLSNSKFRENFPSNFFRFFIIFFSNSGINILKVFSLTLVRLAELRVSGCGPDGGQGFFLTDFVRIFLKIDHVFFRDG